MDPSSREERTCPRFLVSPISLEWASFQESSESSRCWFNATVGVGDLERAKSTAVQAEWVHEFNPEGTADPPLIGITLIHVKLAREQVG